MSKSSISRTLKILRAYYHLSQTQLANKIEISNSHISELENGKKTPSLDLLFKYADCFNVSVAQIFVLSEFINDESGTLQTKDKKILKIIEWVKEWRQI